MATRDGKPYDWQPETNAPAYVKKAFGEETGFNPKKGSPEFKPGSTEKKGSPEFKPDSTEKKDPTPAEAFGKKKGGRSRRRKTLKKKTLKRRKALKKKSSRRS